MKRRDAIKRTAVAAGTLAVPSAVMALGQHRGIMAMSPAELIAIYDPTLDPDATGPWQFPDEKLADYEPLRLDIDRLEASGSVGDIMATGAVVSDDFVKSDILVVFNGHPVRGVTEGSAKDGWVRFLAHRSTLKADGTTTAIAPYKHPNGLGPVSGLAFGRVEWWVRKGKILDRP